MSVLNRIPCGACRAPMGLMLPWISVVLAVVRGSSAQPQTFAACGTITVGPQGCFVFHPDAGGNYFLENTGGFGPNEHVQVAGTLDQHECPPINTPGIVDNAVYQCLDACGTIVEGVECNFFQPDGTSQLWLLQNSGGFGLGSHVHVIGGEDPFCASICLQGNGCIRGNTIEPCAPPVVIVSANPPTADGNGGVPFRDVLQDTTAALVPQGIGLPGTPDEVPVTYAPFRVTFSGTPSPAPAPGNITVACTDSAGNGPADCPGVTTVSGSGAGPYLITLSAAPPARECTTFTFAGTTAGQKLQYQNLPGDVNRNGTTTGQDILALAAFINSGIVGDLPRLDTNRNGTVTGQDVLRLVQLLNGANASQAFNGATVAACP